jgi:excinuclease ABC subunit C
MKGLFARQAFTGFGPHGLLPQTPPLTCIEGRRPRRLRARVRAECPRLPGVYGMVDAAGELVYIGKAKNLRARLLSYFRPNSRDAKAGRIVEATRLIAWEPAHAEFAALLRELELIRRWQPRFNVAGQPRRQRRCYVCVGRKPAPYVFLSRRPPAKTVVFGPVPAGETARTAVRRVNDWFRLRDCPQSQEMVFADQKELFPVLRTPGCLRHEIGNCLGPCAAACSRSDYRGNVQAALAFLAGDDRTPLEQLQREMSTASAALAFERAAALRDRLEALTWLCDRLTHVRRAADVSFVYPVTGHDGAECWYLIRRGRVRAVLPRPADESAARTAAASLAGVFQAGADPGSAPTPEEVDGVLLTAAWFRRYPGEREKTWQWSGV